MPCPSINLKSYKAEIISLFQNNNSAFIACTLQNKYNLQIKKHMIESCLQEWKIHKWNCMIDYDTVLHAWIKILFFQNGLEKKKLLCALQDERFEITLRTLKDLCLQLDLQHHTNSIEAQQQTDEIIQAIKKELKKETIEKYRKKLLHCHFWSKDFMIAWWVIQFSEACWDWL